MQRTYPVWIDSDTSILVRAEGSVHRATLHIEHGRLDEPAIALVGSLAALQQLVIEADRQLSSRLLSARQANSCPQRP